MSAGRAWVTLATNDSYSLGALVLAHSLRRVNSAYPAVILVTPGVTDAMRERLQAVYAEVISVDVLDSGDAAHLALLARPELGITFTKLHCWTLTQYEKCVFLDADTLVLQNSDELFDREELSAAPDIGWPDCFNSGVFVYRPSQETFQALLEHARQRGSFDGGDQGLLNTFFSSWAHGDIAKHLPFLYNVCSTAFYSYLPALKQYGGDMKIMHFIGNAKPWLQSFDWERRSVAGEGHLKPALQLWWDIFCSHVHSSLDVTMAGIAGTFSQITLGAEGQQYAIDESMRRQGWEAGNIDYMGADSFTNIWAKISQTLSETSTTDELPKEPSPSKEEVPPTSIPHPASSTPSESAPTEQAVLKEPSPIKESSPLKEPELPKEPEPSQPIEPELPKEATPPVEPLQVIESTTPVEAALPEEQSPSKEDASSIERSLPKELEIDESKPLPPSLATKQEDSTAEITAEAKILQSEDIKLSVESSKPEAEVDNTVVDVVSVSGNSITSAVAEQQVLIAKSDEPSDVPIDASPACPILEATENEELKDDRQEQTEAPETKKNTPKEKLICHLKPAPEQDILLTPDSELEDADSIAQSIIASEQSISSPIVTSATPTTDTTPPVPQSEKDLCVDTNVPETPPVRGLVSLAQIGIIPGDANTETKQDSQPTIESTILDPIKDIASSQDKKIVAEETLELGDAKKTPESITEDVVKSATAQVIQSVDDQNQNTQKEERLSSPPKNISAEVIKIDSGKTEIEKVLETTTPAESIKEQSDKSEDDINISLKGTLKTEENIKSEDTKSKQLPKEATSKKTPVKPPPPKASEKSQSTSTAKAPEKSELKSDPPVPPPRKKEKKQKK